MSASNEAELYRGRAAVADQEHQRGGLIIGLVCMALAFVIASLVLPPIAHGSGSGDAGWLIGP
jgi:hypothetical protein